MITVDRFIKGTTEFDNLEQELFNNYFPTFNMTLVNSWHYTEIYRVEGSHKVICNYCSGKLYEIIVKKHYYLYNE